MRLVLDTNTALSGLLWGGPPGQLMDAAAARRIELASSFALLAELQGVLNRPKFVRQLVRHQATAAVLFEGYAALALIVDPSTIAPTILRDPSDDHVLAAALAAGADLIVSGDRHLLDLGTFDGIDIVPAATAVQRIHLASQS